MYDVGAQASQQFYKAPEEPRDIVTSLLREIGDMNARLDQFLGEYALVVETDHRDVEDARVKALGQSNELPFRTTYPQIPDE